MEGEPTVISMREACEIADVCWDTMIKHAKADDNFPGRRFGSKWRINKDLFLLWIGNVPKKDWPKYYRE